MRLALVTDRYPPDTGGLARAVARISGGLRAAGHEVDVLCATSAEPPGRVRWDDLGRGGRVCRVGAQRREDDTGAQLFDELVGAHRRAAYDLLHGFYLVRAGFLAAYAARYLGLPSVVSARGNDLDRALFDPSQRAGILKALELAAVVTAVSQDLGRKARALAPAARVMVVPNGVDATLFRPQARDERLAASLALEGRRVIGFSGELRQKKGLAVLLDALERLSTTRPVALLAVGGVRPDDAGQVELFRRRHPQVALALVDWREPEDLPAYYGLMDVFVHPSLRDGLANALLEAMACGRPVVASTVGGLPDALRHRQQGLLVPPGDAPALAQAIEDLLEAPGRAATYAAAARSRVEAEFTPELEIERTLAAYAAARQVCAAADDARQ